MNKKNRIKLADQLEACQARARVRTMGIKAVIDEATAIERFLRKAPPRTTVKSNFGRVAGCYSGIPEGTFVTGENGTDGYVNLSVKRGPGAFGNRAWTVHAPAGYMIQGPDAHASSGATDDLQTTTIVAKGA